MHLCWEHLACLIFQEKVCLWDFVRARCKTFTHCTNYDGMGGLGSLVYANQDFQEFLRTFYLTLACYKEIEGVPVVSTGKYKISNEYFLLNYRIVQMNTSF